MKRSNGNEVEKGMAKILVIEDDKEINKLICEYLSTVGYDMLSEFHGMAGLSTLRVREDINLVLLDLMLPFQSGDVVLKKLREFSQVPVIILSAKDTVQTKIDVIRMGADDYITKPFDLDEVVVRIEAVLRRYGAAAYSNNTECDNMKDRDSFRGESDTSGNRRSGSGVVITFKNMTLNEEAKTITVNGNKLELTSKEYRILELLLKNQSKLFSKVNLFESVWNEPYFAEDNTLKVHMSNIRNKIKKYDDEEYIETIWGMGYKLKK